jgi:hypothetical protein
MDAAKKEQAAKLLLDSMKSNDNVQFSEPVKKLIEDYEKDLTNGDIDQNTFYEEVLAVTSDGLSNQGIDIQDIGLFKSLGDKFLKAIGWRQTFNSGLDVVNFLKDFNKDIASGKGLSAKTLKAGGVQIDQEVDMDLETEVDLGVVKSKKLPPETETYMELDNEVLQQGLNDALQNETDQRFPLAQAVVEKNWPLISKSLNINNQQEMDAAKEVVIDQILGIKY